MSNDITYIYASGDLLENRNTYFYSTYEGEGFLNAWREQRNHALLVTDRLESSTEKYHITAPVEKLLKVICHDLKTHGVTEVSKHTLDRLVQKFEISKRLYGEYDEYWRPLATEDYRVLERYVLFAEALHLAYSLTDMLTYINAVIKCMDILTAMRKDLTVEQSNRLRYLITYEKSHVQQLAEKLVCG